MGEEVASGQGYCPGLNTLFTLFGPEPMLRLMSVAQKKGSPRSRLSFRDALLIKCAEGWLALGIAEEAFREIRKLKIRAALHPDAVRVFQQLQHIP